MRLLIVRHGESVGNAEGLAQGHADYDLSPKGRAQTERLRERLQADGFKPTHVYSSPLRRAAETAEILAVSWNAPLVHWDDLKEYDFGILTGLTGDEFREKYPEVDLELERSRRYSGLEGAEPLAERRARGRRVVDAVLGRHGNDDVVVIVCHAGILKQVFSALLGTDRTWGFDISNTAVFDFTIDTDRRRLSDKESLANTDICHINLFNDTTHLREGPDRHAEGPAI